MAALPGVPEAGAEEPMSEVLRCGGTRRISQPITVPYCDPGDSPTVSETDCPGCPDCRPNRVQIGKYMMVELCPVEGRKTSVWSVLDEDGGLLGAIRWWGAWRQYVFQPENLTVFHNGCLSDLAAFLTKANEEHRRECRERKGAK